jgi:hypothetical protein
MRLLLAVVGFSFLACNALNHLRSVNDDSDRRLLSNPAFLPNNGLIVMEAESVIPIAAPWKFESNLTDYSGRGFLRFDGNKPTGGDPLGELNYFFRIDDPGQYQLVMRLRNNNKRAGHLSNDCYARVPGQESYLGVITKAYLAARYARATWKWSTKLEVDHDAGFFPEPIYTFETPGIYELQLFGRSRNLFVDRIILYRTDNVTFDFAKSLARPESQRETLGEPVKAPAASEPFIAPVIAPAIVPFISPIIAPVIAPVSVPASVPVIAPVSVPVRAPVLVPVTQPVLAPIPVPVTVPVSLPVPVLCSNICSCVGPVPVVSAPGN